MAHDTQNNVAKRKRGRPRHNRRYADMISALPDSILCHILSYIPTKHAVATSIIARRWKNVWTAMPNLSFDDRFCQRPPASTYVPLRGFADFVHTVLLRTNPAKIAKFSLYCSRPTNLASVPHCLVHTVKNIEIKGVQGDEDERPLLKYLFKFASAMETMLMWSKASVPSRILPIIDYQESNVYPCEYGEGLMEGIGWNELNRAVD
ncbi:hypothetical protein CUMW_059690 [Citrus unshiu]|uniref:F-box domain-containing protein n=1 Tax=Citrus unshiu TaxID=55188 RepID=A0A2H5NNH7_CITUN|nr:hypothetical protein CUMW_059690 [Citrus unshiu]